MAMILTGIRGCRGKTHRRGTERFCAQWEMDYSGYCYYHQPGNPKSFGDGYISPLRRKENKHETT